MITYTNFKSINDRYWISLVLFIAFCCFSTANLTAQECIVGDEEVLAKWDFNSNTEACNGLSASKSRHWNARKALVLDGANTYCPNINSGCGQAIFSGHGFGNTNDFANGVCLAGFNGGRWIWPYNHATDWDPNSTTFNPEAATLYTKYTLPAGSPGILTGFASTLVSRGAADGSVQFAKQGVAVYRNGVLIYSTETALNTGNTGTLLDFPFPATSEFKSDGSESVEFEIRFAMVNRLRGGLSGFDDFCIRGICGGSGGADVAASPSTCAPDATDNGSLTISEFTPGEKYDYTLGATYTGTKTFANADLIPTGGVIVDTISVKAMATQYTIRVFREDCYQDVTVTMPPTFCPFTCNFPAATVAVTQATCSGETANNNASINVTGISNANRIGMSVGQTYTGPDYEGATDLSGTSFLFDNLNNPTCKEYYTIRIFNGSDESPDQCVNTFTVVLDEVSCNGCLIACASIESSTSLETSPSDNLGKGELCVEEGNIDLELTKTVTPNSGETCPSETEFVWTVTVTNKGDITATEVVVFENLAVGLSADNIVTSVGTFNGFGDWKVGDLAPNASETLVFSSKAMAAGTYENCAYISNALPDNDIDSSPDNDNTANEDDDACATITVTGPNLPTLTKEFSPFTTRPNLPSTLVLRLFNNDTLPIVLTQDLVDVLPNDPAQMVVAPDPNINTLLGGVTAEPGASTITVASGTVLLPGLNLLEVDVVAPTAGLYCNIIGIGDLATSACTNVDSVVGCLEVGDFVVTPLLSKSFDKEVTEVGDQANLTIVIENRNPTNLELVMDFMDAMPSGLTLAGSMSGTCPSITNFNGDSLTVGIAAGALIPPGGCTIIVPVTATLAKDYCNVIDQNELVVMGTANGITEMIGNRSVAKATLTAVENPIFDLALKKTLAGNQADTVTVGSTVTYDIMILNQGTTAGTAINVTDYIPTGLTLVTGGGWEMSGDDAVLVNPIPSLAAGADTVIQIQFTIDINYTGSSIVNMAEITSATGGTDKDSTPDAIENNDKGGKVASPTDNSIFGNAKLSGGAPQDENGLTDEDDADPAIIFLKTEENPTCAVVLSLDPQDCNTGDNTYNLDGAINFTNAPTTGNLIVVIDGATVQTFNAPFTSPQVIAVTGLNADGQNHTVSVQFSAEENCQTTLMYAAPSPCLASSTCSVSVTVNAGSCDSATNTYDLTGAITFTDAPTTGTLTVAVGGFQQTFAAPLTSPQNYTLTGLAADGSNHTVAVSFSDDVACSDVTDYIAPGGCDPVECGATVTVTAGTCNAATNTFDLSGSVTFTNAPTTGSLVVEVGGDTMTFAAPFNSPQAFTINGLVANGQPGQARAYFSDEIACTATADFDAPVACSPSVCAMSMELSPSPCADDKYVLNGTINFVNPPSTGMLTVREGGTVFLELSLPLTSPLGFTIPGLTADGASHTFQVSFSDDLACADDFTYTAPASCSGNCAVSGTVTDIECRDNGTDADTGDDYTIFSLNPTGTNLGGTYSVTSDAGTVYRLSGATATNVPYGSATVFRLTNGSADGTDKMISIMDDANPACTEGPLTITAPDPCSVVPCTTIENPISETICANETYAFGGQDINTAGTYRDTLTAANSCDSVVILTLTVLPTAETPITEEICNGDSFTFNNKALTTAGTYRDTMTAANGCDSVIVLTLNVLDTVQTPITQDICNGDTYNFNNQDLTTAGTYRDTMTAANGCDSFIVLTLNVIDALETNLNESICDGDSYTFDGQDLTTAGTYRDTMTAVSGCDSILILTLDILNPVQTDLDEEICQGDSYTFDNQALTTAGTYRDTTTGSNGCDSIIVLTLSILDTVQIPITEEICQGDTFTFNNQDLTAAGTYRDTMTAANGCDSFIVLTLNVLPTAETPITEEICNGDSFTFNSQALTTAGTYRDTMTTANGCDSVIALTLNVLDTVQTPITQDICSGNTYTFNNQDLSTAGTYRDTMTAANGCDSFIVLTLNVIEPLATNLNESICDGDSYTFDGQDLTTAGTYRDTMTAASGCDSILILTLNILNPVQTDLEEKICQGDSYTFDNQALTTAGTYRDTTTGSNGCDSIIVLTLSILDTVQAPITEEICQGDTFTFNNQDLTAAGTYRDTMTAANGCDSFIVLTLNVLPTAETPITEEICNGDSFTFNSQALTTAGTYRDTMTAANGCDSVIALTLNVLDTVQTPITQDICNGDTYNFNNQDLTTAGTYRDTMTATNGCDSFIVLTLNVIDALETNLNESICDGDSYTFDGQALTTAGTYRDTMTAAVGCDSIIILTLNILDPVQTDLNEEICQGGTYTFDNQNLTTAGTYRDTTTSSNGCDSIVVLTLSILDTVQTPVTEEICQGDTFTFNNQDLTAAGTYRDTLVAANGCDSFIVLTLNILNTAETPITEEICNGDSFTFNNQALTTAGTYRDTMTAANGCDSVIVLTLNVLDTVQTPITQDICNGDTYNFNNQDLTTAGTYRDTMTAANGCDSFIVLTLNVIDALETNLNESICDGDSYTFDGQALTTAGTYRDTMTAAFGCDSIIILTLNILDPVQTDLNEEICQGGTYTFDNQNLTTAGTYRDTTTSSNGCDSIVVLTLSILDTVQTPVTEEICQGDTFTFNNQDLTAAGTYRDTLVAANGCDSFIVLTLNILNTAETPITENICNGDTYTFNTATLTTAGIYRDTLTAANGCDSMIVLTLNVLDTVQTTINETICQGENYTFNTQNLTTAGVYRDTMTAANGCDSFIVLTLNVMDEMETMISEEICNGENLTFNNQTLTTAGTYRDTLTATGGCDSIIILTLNVVDEMETAISAAICDGNSYDFDNQALTTAGTYRDTMTAAGGCDSIIILTLDILNPVQTAISEEICQGDTYTFNNQALTAAGNYQDTMVAANGCDSIIVLTLDILDQLETTISAAICQDDSYDFDNQALTTAGIYTDTLSAASGCDSIITLTLMVNPNTTANINYEGCENDGYSITVGGNSYDETNPTGTEVLMNANGCDSTVTVNLVFNEEKASEITHFGCREDGYEVAVNGTVYSEANPAGVERFTAANGCDSIVTINLLFLPPAAGGCDEFDLALEKSTDSTVVRLGDLVVYQIKVSNEGNVDAYNIGISDFIPEGMSLADANWTATGNIARFNTPIGFLPAGTSFNLYITLKVNLDFVGTSLVNFAEISEADDDDNPNNTPPTDKDSTPDENPTNPDEDDDDSAVVSVIEEGEEIFDLALIEELAPGQSGMVKPGDEVDLKITVFNQGTLPAETIKITQYLPADVTLNDNNPQGWTAMNDSTAMITLTAGNGLPIGGLVADSMVMVMIQVVIDENTTAIKLTPHAEISDDGVNDDNDSTPDDDRTNDVGGQPNTDTDNASDQIAPVDEDDHDPVQLMMQEFDLALTEELLTEGPVGPGDSITGKIKVFNQGEIAADNIKLFAYIPAGLTLDDNRWTAMDDSTAMLTLTVADGDLPTGGLTSDEMTMITIGFTIDPTFMDTCLITYAEIGGATDENGNPTNDVDSTPDGDSTNDTGGEVHTPTDNQIFSTPPMDEDDHDPMKIAVEQTFDLALEKSTDSMLVRVGDLVTYQIEITNEGSLNAYNISVTDFLPTGMSLQDNNWTASGDTLRFNNPIAFLGAGQSTVIEIVLQVNSGTENRSLMNFAEISSADDDDNPDNEPPVDEDSTPDEDKTNDDEDDDDTAVVTVIPPDVFDLAIIETLAPDQPGMVRPGATVDFKITVFNQGNITADTIKLTQYLPVGLTLNTANPQGWTTMDDSTAMILLTAGNGLPVGGLAADGMVMVMIQTVVAMDAPTNKLTAYAEISEDGEGNNDHDSTPDDNRTNDIGGMPNTDADNAYDQIPPMDEDDHDPVLIMLQEFDLALTEELITEGEVELGDTITAKIKIFNQGDIPADNIKIFAYIPAGMSLADDRWAAMNDSTAMITLTTATNELSTGGLAPNSMTMLTIDFVIDPNFREECLITYAEIGNATDENGEPITDVDSTPDDDRTNDTGGEVDTTTDNEVNATAPTDEDDHDPVKIAIKQTFDLALIIELARDQKMEVPDNDTVCFNITVINQGTQDAYDIGIVNYVPLGLTYDAGLNQSLGTDWQADSTYQLAELLVGDTAIIPIKFISNMEAMDSIVVDTAEIYFATTEDGSTINTTDIDSQADDVNDDFIGGDNLLENERSDEDDHDYVYIVPLDAVDPIGFIYADKTGKIIKGGTISVTAPPGGVVFMIEDGSTGMYQWFTNGVQGEYVMTYMHPNGAVISPNCNAQTGVYDPTGRDGDATDMDGDATNGIVQLGTVAVNADSTYLLNPTCGNNPYYLRFFLQSGDPIIDGNNIAIQESFIGSIVCEDTNGNGQSDAGEDGIPNALVYLYACADTINPIDSTLTNAQGAYNFDGLNAGDYMVQFTAPDGYRLPKDAVPANEIADRDGFSQCINLTTGQCDTTTTVCMTACTEIVATVSATNIIQGETITISLTGGPEFIWSVNSGITNTTTAVATLSPSTNTTYTVTVNDTYGCSQTLTIPIKVTPLVDNYVRIADPCNCTTESINNVPAFTDRITIFSLTPNDNWTVAENKGIYSNGNLVTVGTSFIPGEIVDGYYTYSMPIQHLDVAGYMGRFSNGTDELTAMNTCFADQSCSTTIVTTPDGTPGPPVVGPPIIIIPSGPTPLMDTLADCSGTDFRSEGAEDNTLYYDDSTRNNVMTICAQNAWQSLLVSFNEFDLATGDTLYVFEGRDTLATQLIGRFGGTGVSQTGGWVASNCDPKINAHGCLTFQFKTNGDNAKGLGWRAKVTCKENNITLTPPNNLSANLDCEDTYALFDIKPLAIMADCGNVQDSQIVRIFNQHGVICLDTCLADADVVRDTFALGAYRVEYKLKSDTTKTAQSVLSVQGRSLVCNDEINVPLGASCAIQLTPDDLLESACDTITDTMYYFISIIGKDKNGNDIVLASGGGKGGNYPMVDKDMIDQCGGAVKARIERRYFEGTDLTICNNGAQSASCEVTVNLMDQSAPIFTNLPPVDTFVTCAIDLTQTGLGLPTPEAVDNCDSAKVAFAGATILNEGGACDTTRAIVNWTATDACGNVATATQNLVFIRPSLDDIVKTSKVTLSCDGNDGANVVTEIPGIKIGRLKNGVLIPSDTIQLSTEEYVCGYILENRDVFIPANDCGKKIIRYWTILDWCDAGTGPQAVDTTFIEFTDTKAPEFATGAGATANIALDHFACTYDITKIATPAATDNCSTPTVRLNKVSRIENGAEWLVPVTEWASLDCDSFQLEWIASDDCHEQLVNDTVNQIIIIEDVTKPSAVCTDKLHISLGRDEVKVHYSQVDGGSSDACGIAKYEVSRDEITWDSIAVFGCEDLHQDNKLYLRVTDTKGNQNTCWMTIIVEDKIAPICSDLPTMTGSCDDGHGNGLVATDLNDNGEMDDNEWVDLTKEQAAEFNTKYGNPSCSDNVTCQVLVIQQQYQLIEKACGIATIKRRYRAIDWAGQGMTSAWAEQTINIESKADWTITLPADWKGSCGETVPTSEVQITNGACDLMAYEVEEKVFGTNSPSGAGGDACLKVVRTFTIINWCNYQVGDEGQVISRVENEHGIVTAERTITSEGMEKIGKLTYIQILKLTDETAPIITVEPIDDCLTADDCQAPKRFAISATDCNEAATAALTYSWTISAGDTELGNGIGAEFNYPVATGVKYEVAWQVVDNCGNTAVEKATYQFTDCKKPAPYCLHGVAVELMPDAGMIQIWASDLDAGSSDNCTSADKLALRIWHKSLGEAPTHIAGVLALPENITFDCAYLGNQEVNIYVIDEANNWDYCTGYVNVQDNMGACDNIEAEGMAVVSGTIMDWRQQTVEQVEVTSIPTGANSSSMTTRADGHYDFELAMNNAYTIQPEKDMHPLNGVSTFDLVLMAKHILGVQTFENPYQMIAADVNGSGTITAFDMVQIRQLILNITTEFSNSPSWKFVYAGYEFTTDNPMSETYPQVATVANLQQDMEMDFVAIKIGDVNGNANPNGFVQATDRTIEKAFEITTEDKALKTGEKYTVTFSTDQLANIQGYQFTLGYDDLKVDKLKSGVVGVENFGLHKMDKGMITTSWNQTSVGSTQLAVGSPQLSTVNRQPSTVLFTIEFTAETDGKLSEQLSILDRPTAIEAYDKNGDLMKVELTFTTPNLVDEFELFQNQPNPFHDKTMIGCYLPGDSEVQLILRDETGRVLKTIKEDRKAGYNTFEFQKEELTNGFIYYQLSTKFGIKAKKMLKLN